MKDKSKKSTYSTTFGIDPKFCRAGVVLAPIAYFVRFPVLPNILMPCKSCYVAFVVKLAISVNKINKYIYLYLRKFTKVCAAIPHKKRLSEWKAFIFQWLFRQGSNLRPSD